MAIGPVPQVYPIAPGSSSTLLFTGIVVGFLLLFPFVLLLIPLWPGKIELVVSDAGLQISGSMYGRLISHPDGTSARKWVPSDEPGYQPVSRTNGIGLPNYRGGWFRLANGSKALVFLTDESRSVLVPTNEEYTLLTSPQDPDGFISALAARDSRTRDTQPLRFPLAQSMASNREESIWTFRSDSLGPFSQIRSLISNDLEEARSVRSLGKDGGRARQANETAVIGQGFWPFDYGVLQHLMLNRTDIKLVNYQKWARFRNITISFCANTSIKVPMRSPLGRTEERISMR
jgi:hypothetical protein